MKSISVPPSFVELEKLTYEELQQLKRMVNAVMKEKKPAESSSGRGNNIFQAFMAVPNEPVDANTFCEEHHVSMNTLRQSKRFDPHPDKGKVVVRKNSMDGKYYVWRIQQ